MLLIGLDCATNYRNVGLALGEQSRAHPSTLSIHEARVARSAADIVSTLVAWLSQDSDGVLAIDAPLGWPRALGEGLARHVAGALLAFEAHALFRRETDREIKRRVGLQSLDVGADRIARTAHAALSVVAQVRSQLGFELGMGWTPGSVTGRQCIEVYPAATLKALGLVSRGYKGNESRAARASVIEQLNANIAPEAKSNAIACDHVFDAVVCACAGADYVSGVAVAPTDVELAQREGWIWCR